MRVFHAHFASFSAGALVIRARAAIDRRRDRAPKADSLINAMPRSPAMSTAELASTIDAAWEARDQVNAQTKGAVREAVETAIDMLDKGKARTAEKKGEDWVVNQWLKKAVLLSFRLNDMGMISGAPGGASWWDKVPSKFAGMSPDDFKKAAFRAVPGAVVRRGAYVAPNVVLMPSFVNLGAYVGERTMVDTWATVGSCAQIGKNVHLSGGVGIGGGLEPMQAGPSIIEDTCFIGARSEVVEGCIIREGSVLGMGVFIGKSTKLVARATGEITYGEAPPYSVVVAGTMPGKPFPNGEPGPSLYCAVIVKRVDEKTRSKTGINELLRD